MPRLDSDCECVRPTKAQRELRTEIHYRIEGKAPAVNRKRVTGRQPPGC